MPRTKYWLRKGPSEARWVLFNWNGLPAELQFMVLEHLIPRCDELGFIPTRGSHLAAYSTVCRDWQAHFEKFIFHRLVLHQDDLPRFAEEFMLDHVSLLRHLWLRVELPRYHCWGCQDGNNMGQENEAMFGRALAALFEALAVFEVEASEAGIASHPGLTLEISSHSPSDPEHDFREISFDDAHVAPYDAPPAPNDPGHFWVNGRRTMPPTRGSLHRLFGGFGGLRRLHADPPALFSVRSLLVRRQTRHQITPVELRYLFQSLRGLRTVRFESWRMQSRIMQDWQDDSWYDSFRRFITRDIEALTLFEEFNEEFDSILAGESLWEAELVREPSLQVSAVLSQLRNLRSLNASFAVDAQHFFFAVPPDMPNGEPLEKLTHLSLTARQLRPAASCAETEDVLLLAAGAARLMPNLRMMELWHGRRGEAFLFRYNVVDRHAEISWAGTWSLKLQPWVVKAWEGVSKRPLRVGPGRVFSAKLVRSHGDAIHHLRLLSDVVHPRSLTQIRREQQV